MRMRTLNYYWNRTVSMRLYVEVITKAIIVLSLMHKKNFLSDRREMSRSVCLVCAIRIP